MQVQVLSKLQGEMNRMDRLSRAKIVLSVDSGAGLTAGILVLSLRHTLQAWYGLPEQVLVFIGTANLVYGLYSGSLAIFARVRRLPGRHPILFLIAANLCWSAVCPGIIATNWTSVSWLGLGLVMLEGTFVAILAAIEFRVVLPVA